MTLYASPLQLTMSHTKSSSSRMLGQLFQLIGDPCRWFRGLDFMLWMCLGSRSNAKVTINHRNMTLYAPCNWPCHIPRARLLECLVNFFNWLVILVGGLEDLILCCGCAWVQDQMQKLQPSQHDLICTMQLTMSHTKSSSSRMLVNFFNWLVILVGGLEDLILCCGCAWVQDQMQKLQPSQHDLICSALQLTMSHTKSSSSRMLGQLF